MTESSDPPFGSLRPSPAQERARALARRLPDNVLARKLSSLLLGPAGGRARRGYDVAVFETARARLHPFDNIAEKRVYLTPQHWDPKERALLARAIARSDRDDFIFVDVGANAGLYTLFACAAAAGAGKRLLALCVEPDPVMRARLQFNVAASGAERDVAILPFAATAVNGPQRFAANARNRGMSRLDAAGDAVVEGRTLPSLLREAGLSRIDALKIDVEGHEEAALAPLLRDEDAPRPQLLLVETSHEPKKHSLRILIENAGYATLFDGQLNAIFEERRKSQPRSA